MKIRIKFRKYGVMRFVGHLDMMRYFQKAMRRANIDIRYSEGFSPHQIMSFAAPLGVGITSDGEYLDIEVSSTLTSEEALHALNAAMAEGVTVTQYRLLPEGAGNAMASVAAADYEASFPDSEEEPFPLSALREALHAFYEGQEQIPVTKQTKKGERQMDLKPLILRWEALECPGFFLRLCAGSGDNVKPELALDAFFGWCKEQGISLPVDGMPAMQIHRLEVYGRGVDGALMPLGDFGHEIL